MLGDIGAWLILDLDIEILDLIWEVVGFLRRGVDDVLDAQVFQWLQIRGILGIAQVQEVFDDFWRMNGCLMNEGTRV